jgi:hypothetical protein
MIEWIFISNNLNTVEIAKTITLLSSGRIPTVVEKREFAFRLSLTDFDKRGDMRHFN